MCEKLTLKKYSSRPSPPYPANKCKNKTFIGNDGNAYKSVRAANGVYRWKKSPPKRSPKNSPKRSPKRSKKNKRK